MSFSLSDWSKFEVYAELFIESIFVAKSNKKELIFLHEMKNSTKIKMAHL